MRQHRGRVRGLSPRIETPHPARFARHLLPQGEKEEERHQCNECVVVQHHCQLMQLRIAKTFRLDRLHRRQDIFAVGARLPVPLLHVTELLRQRQPPGILHVPAVDHVDQRADPLPRLVLQPHRPHHLAIHRGDLLARAQIGDRIGAVLRRDPERDAAAGAAAVEAEHEARLFRRAAMHEGVDAERAMLANQPSHSRTPTGRLWTIRLQAGFWLASPAGPTRIPRAIKSVTLIRAVMNA